MWKLEEGEQLGGHPRHLGPAECWGPPEAPFEQTPFSCFKLSFPDNHPHSEQKPKASPRLKITPGAISNPQDGAVLATGARLCLSNWQEPTRGTSLQKQDRGRKNVLKPRGGEGGEGSCPGEAGRSTCLPGAVSLSGGTRLSQLGPLLHQQYTDITLPPSPVT